MVMMMALSLLAEEPILCNASGCCKESNKRKQFSFISCIYIYIHFQKIETCFIQAVLCSVTIFHGNTGDRIHIIMSVCTQMVSSKTQSKQVPLV